MARRPLPRAKAQAAGPGEGHAGLWYEKLAAAWPDDEWSLKARHDGTHPKLEWMRPLVGTGSTDKVGNLQLLKEHCTRQKLLAERLGGRILELENRSPFVTGLGQAHPIENGFLWHPVLGVPYLPGSGVKGVLRGWLGIDGPELVAALGAESTPGGENDAPAGLRDAEIDRLLGSPGRAGAIDLLSLVPSGVVRLRADLVNPHHGAYLRGREWPADWQDPVPSFFLAVAPRSHWQLAVVPGAGAQADDVDLAVAWLAQAADWIGFGAKTAVGYGRFR